MRALLVEDEEDLRELEEIWLIQAGYKTVAVTSGLKATEVLIHDQTFDILVTDFNMPEMDGLDLLQWCREHKIHFPVIFTTANNGNFPREKLAINDCCAELLKKPFSSEDFDSALCRARERNHDRQCREN